MASAAQAGLVATYRFNHMYLPGLLDSMSDEDLKRTFGESGRCAWWQLGHVVASRRFLGKVIGSPPAPIAWAELFSIDSDPTPTADWPARDLLLADFDSAGCEVLDALSGLPEEQLASDVPALFEQDAREPLADQVAFLLMHESYHIGQIGYIRSALGLPYLA